MKTRNILFGLLATSGLVLATVSACGSDNPIGGPTNAGGSTGAGGFPPGQGGSGTASGATGGGSSVTGFSIDAGGYVLAGTWKGYAFTAGVTSKAAGAVTTTINPANFSAVAAGATELCADGSIGAASDYGGVAMIGVNVNQDQLGVGDAGPTVNTVGVTGTGITISYSQTVKTEIRIQIQTIAGETDPMGRWCAVLKGSTDGATVTETVTWAQFWGGTSVTTDGCWNSGGSHPAADGSVQISQVALLVPGGNTAAVPYNFCLKGLASAS